MLLEAPAVRVDLEVDAGRRSQLGVERGRPSKHRSGNPRADAVLERKSASAQVLDRMRLRYG